MAAATSATTATAATAAITATAAAARHKNADCKNNQEALKCVAPNWLHVLKIVKP